MVESGRKCKKKGAYRNNQNFVSCSHLGENLAAPLHRIQFITAFLVCIFKSPAASLKTVFFYSYIERSPCPKRVTSVHALFFTIHHRYAAQRGSFLLFSVLSMCVSNSVSWPSGNLSVLPSLKNHKLSYCHLLQGCQSRTVVAVSKPNWYSCS